MHLQSADESFRRLIIHSQVAASCRMMARRELSAAGSLQRAADKHSAAATALLNEWITGLALGGATSTHPVCLNPPPRHGHGFPERSSSGSTSDHCVPKRRA